MPSFTKIKEFETDNDLNGFEQLIENLYLKASFPALLSLATTLKEGKGEFYDAAFRLWMKKFLEYTNTSSSAAKNVYIAEAISALIIDSQLPVEEPIAMYNEQTDDNKELIRRMLFTYLRNTAPGGGRVRPRKALILMGSSSVKENEEAFTPSLWILYTELLKYTISGDPTFLKKAVDSCKHTITQHEEGALEFILESLQDSSLKELIMTVPDPESFLREKAQLIYTKRNTPPELEKFYLESPVPIEIEETELPPEEIPEEDEEDPYQLFLDIESGYYNEEEAIEKLLEIIKQPQEDEFTNMVQYLQEHGEEFILKDRLRREAKMLMADSDISSEISDRAFEIVSYLGSASPSSRTAISALSLDDFDDEDDEEENETVQIFHPVTLPFEEDLIYTLPQPVIDFLKKEEDVKKLISEATHILEDAQLVEPLSKLLELHIFKSGKLLFDKITATAKAILLRSEIDESLSQFVVPAKNTLLYILCYNDSSDMVKMEAFEALHRTGYFSYRSADTIKKYGIAFAKESLAFSRGAACRALADLISLKSLASSRAPQLDGKSANEIATELINLLIKDRNLRDAGIELLNHISFEDPLRLRALSDKIQPLNYKDAIYIASELALRHNRWAALILVEAAGEDFTDIRDEAVRALGKTGTALSSEMRERAIQLIFEKSEECYDEDMIKFYFETSLNIDVEKAALFLLKKMFDAGIGERKLFGRLLMQAFDRLSAPSFLQLFGESTNLPTFHRFLKCTPKDNFIAELAIKFVEVYRERYVTIYGEAAWEQLFSIYGTRTSTGLGKYINEIWSLKFT